MPTRQLVAASMVVAALTMAVHAAAPVIYTTTSNLLPNTLNQPLQIYVSGTDLIQGESLNFYIDTGSSGPIFTGVDILSGTFFAADNIGAFHPNDPGFNAMDVYTASTYSSHLASVSTFTATSSGLMDMGLLATLWISTSATTGSTFVLNMVNTPNGGSKFSLGDLAGTTLGLSQPHIQFSIGSAVRQWNVNGSGSWLTDSNWTPFAPYAQGDTANFLGTLTLGTATITLDGVRVGGTINFDDTAGSYDLEPGVGGVLQLNNGTQSAVIADLAGTHSIGAPVTLLSNASVFVADGSTLTARGGISGSGYALSVSGPGKLLLTGSNSYGVTNIAAGSTLQVGNGTVSGTLGTGAINNAGQLNAANLSYPIAVPMGGSGTVTVTNFFGLNSVDTGETWLIMPTGTLQVGNGGTTGLLSGSNVINGGNLAFDRSDAVTQNATVSGAGTVSQIGTGTTTLTNYQGSGAINVLAGKLSFAKTTAARGTAAVMVTINGLTMNSGTVLDLTNHDAIITGASFSTINSYIAAGLGQGVSNSPGIIASNSLVYGGSGDNAIPVPLSPALLSADGITSWDGVNIPAGATLVVYALVGDAALEGTVNGDAYAQVTSNFGRSTPSYADIGTAWTMGDVTLEGVVNGDDYAAITSAFGQSPQTATNSLIPAAGGGVVGTPEPATLAMLGLGAGILTWRRRRNSSGLIAPNSSSHCYRSTRQGGQS